MTRAYKGVILSEAWNVHLLEEQVADLEASLRNVDRYEKRMLAALEKIGASVTCGGFKMEGPPCATCPNDERCPILRPSTRVTILLEKLAELTPGEKLVLMRAATKDV